MNPIAQLWRLLRQKGESRLTTEAKTATEEFRRVDAHANRMLRDKEASDWLIRDRGLDLARILDDAARREVRR